MALWYLAAGYLAIASLFILGTFLAQLVEGMGRPPVHGHLDIRFKLGKPGKWTLISFLPVAPFVLAFWIEWPLIKSAFVERVIWMLLMYGGIILIWAFVSRSPQFRTLRKGILCVTLVGAIGIGSWHFLTPWNYKLKTVIRLVKSNQDLSKNKPSADENIYEAVVPKESEQELTLYVSSALSPGPRKLTFRSAGFPLQFQSDNNGHLKIKNGSQIDDWVIKDWDEKEVGLVVRTTIESDQAKNGGLTITVKSQLNDPDGRSLQTATNVMHVQCGQTSTNNRLHR